jgi:hypothetical protein
MVNDVKYPRWEFIKIRDRGTRTVDPAEGLFFEKLPPLGAVIRESAQNSLDAVAGNGPVHMRISVNVGDQAMPRATADKYLQGLFGHLEASEKWLPSKDENMPYITIEDFGTQGLIGDTEVFFESNSEAVEDNRFYWFHRNTNRTQVRKTRGGSFGYGKASFALSSKISSFFTVSRGIDNSIKVFGNSIAKNHSLAGYPYPPYGDFGFIDEDEEDGIGIVPGVDPRLFTQICNDFQLEREHDAGLSVIVPFPESDYSDGEIIESVIRNYFVPICQGKLTVEVSGVHTVIIDSDTIRSVADRQNWSDSVAGAMTSTNRGCMVGMIDLANWWFQGQEAYELISPGESEPFWHKQLIPEDKYGNLRAKLDLGHPLAIRVSLPIIKKIENGRTERYPENSEIVILLRKQEAYGGSDAAWIRRYLSVPKKEYKPKKSGFVAIILSSDGPLEELLRESEEVAHTEHRPNRIDSKYKYGRAVIRFFRQSATHLIDYLQEKQELLEDHWLDDWFPSEEIDQEQPNKPKKKRKKQKKKVEEDIEDEEVIVGPPPPPEDLSKHLSWELQKLTGGFSILGEVKHDIDFQFKVRLGYSRDDGKDAIKKWKAFDFDISNDGFEFVLDGVVIEKSEGNMLVFRVEGPVDEFSIDVTGFDSQRDLNLHVWKSQIRKELIE